jgi:hypothetical protein
MCPNHWKGRRLPPISFMIFRRECFASRPARENKRFDSVANPFNSSTDNQFISWLHQWIEVTHADCSRRILPAQLQTPVFFFLIRNYGTRVVIFIFVACQIRVQSCVALNFDISKWCFTYWQICKRLTTDFPLVSIRFISFGLRP